MDCETDVKFDTGAIVGSVCLGIIALMVVIGKGIKLNFVDNKELIQKLQEFLNFLKS